MVDMQITSRGDTHTLRLLLTDSEAGVWEALVDGDDYFYFEADQHTALWQLFGIAARSYDEYIGEQQVLKTEWRKRDGR